jgi:hypothetical protein
MSVISVILIKGAKNRELTACLIWRKRMLKLMWEKFLLLVTNLQLFFFGPNIIKVPGICYSRTSTANAWPEKPLIL